MGYPLTDDSDLSYEDYLRYATINILVVLFPPYEWCILFAIACGLIKAKYWNSWDRFGYVLAVFVITPLMIPCAIAVALYIANTGMYLAYLGVLLVCHWKNRILAHFGSFWIVQCAMKLAEYTVIPVFNCYSENIMMPATHMIILPLIKGVLVPMLISQLASYIIEEVYTVIRRNKPMRAIVLIDEEVNCLKDEIEYLRSYMQERDQRAVSSVKALQKEHLEEMKQLVVKHTSEMKARMDEIMRLEDRVDTNRFLYNTNSTEKSLIHQEYQECKARLGAQVSKLEEKLRVLSLQGRADKEKYDRQIGEASTQSKLFEKTLVEVEAFQRKLTSKMNPNEVGPAIASIEAKIKEREDQIRQFTELAGSVKEQLAQKTTEFNDTISKWRATVMQRDGEIRQKDAMIKAREDEIKAKDNEINILKSAPASAQDQDKEFMTEADKQVLIKLAKSSVLTSFIRTIEFEKYVKYQMTLSVGQQVFFPWLLSIFDDKTLDDYITFTFGTEDIGVATMIQYVKGACLGMTDKKRVQMVMLALHPDKNVLSPGWLAKLHAFMFRFFRDEVKKSRRFA